MRPSLFVGSSVEGLAVAYALQSNLEHDVEATVWDQGVFGLTKSSLASLLEAMETFDFAALVLSADDTAKIRATEYSVARDNVVFELGLFIGALGANRTFFLVPRGMPDLHLPSDLAGIMPGSYDANRKDKNLRAALGPLSHAIRLSIQAAGVRAAKGKSNQSGSDLSVIGSSANDDVRARVASTLREFIEEAEGVRAQVLAEQITHQDAEIPLVRWKIKVCRFLDRTVGVEDAKSFYALYTSHGATSGDQHFKSAYQNHISFLEVLVAEIEDDNDYPLVNPPKPSGKLSFAGLRFTYASPK
jgi:hypothetical protein